MASFWKAKYLALQLQIDRQSAAFSVASLTAMTLASSAAATGTDSTGGAMASCPVLDDESNDASSTSLPALALPTHTSPPASTAATGSGVFAKQQFVFSPIVGAMDFAEATPAPDTADEQEGLSDRENDIVTPAKRESKKRKGVFSFDMTH